jgi:hypothetical protein
MTPNTNLATRPPERTLTPLPGRHGRRHPRPLEARTDWDPWLPANEAYPEVPKPIHVAAMVVLAVLALLVLMMVMVSVAM